MDHLIEWLGFAGTWLLVAGPLQQATLELGKERAGLERFRAGRKEQPPEHVSAWWWLLPPVKLVLMHQAANRNNEAIRRSLKDHERAELIGFLNAARAWMFVAAGALLLALKETWTLCQELRWDEWTFWVLVVVMPLVCVVSLVRRLKRSAVWIND